MTEANRSMMRLVWKTHKLIWNLSGGRMGTGMGNMPTLEVA